MSNTKPRAPRWTADTEIAFLMALRLTGSPCAACAAIGRSAQGTYARRRRAPEFAARWDKALEELQRTRIRAAEEERGVSVRSARPDGLTPLKRRGFLLALAESGRFDHAARAVRLSVSAITKARRRDPVFAEECRDALARALPTLEKAAVERAVRGVEQPIYRGGDLVGTRRVYSDSLLRLLLLREDRRAGADLTPEQRTARAHEAARAAGGTFGTRATREETNAAIMKGLAAAKRRMDMRARRGDATGES